MVHEIGEFESPARDLREEEGSLILLLSSGFVGPKRRRGEEIRSCIAGGAPA